jgi:hypothetical protein
MAKNPLSPETLLLWLIRGLGLLALGFLCLAFWHPWQPGQAPDWRCIGLTVACVALATICSWGLHSLKR